MKRRVTRNALCILNGGANFLVAFATASLSLEDSGEAANRPQVNVKLKDYSEFWASLRH